MSYFYRHHHTYKLKRVAAVVSNIITAVTEKLTLLCGTRKIYCANNLWSTFS